MTRQRQAGDKTVMQGGGWPSTCANITGLAHPPGVCHSLTMEIELKLLIAPADAAAFRRLALLKQLATARPVTRLLRNTYFDTPELHLKQQGMELRVRQVGRVFIQTLKAGGQVTAGLHQRQEWEARTAGLRPELAPLIALVEAGTTWQKALCRPSLVQDLAPIFCSEVRRTSWNLHLPQGAAIELVLDQGELQHGDARAPISEVELELKAGAPGVLFDLALQLQQQLPLRIGHLSKAARGYALQTPVVVDAVKAKPVALDAAMTVEQGFRAIAGNCLAQMQDNEAGVIQGSDPECIHQMRVGLRRLRCALRLFAQWIPAPAALQQELAWLAAELGAARDADVLADSTLPQVCDACPTELGLLRLRQAASMIAAQRRLQAGMAVASARYCRLLLGLAGWLQASGWRASLAGSARDLPLEPLPKCAAQALLRCHKRLHKRGKGLLHGTPEQRHRLRIAAKNARYAAEFFKSLQPAGRVKRYTKRLAALLEALGGLNDAAVADRLLRDIEGSHPALAGSAAFTRGYLCAAANQDMPGLARLWRQCRSTKPP